MKNILFFLLISTATFAQSIEFQTEVLSRNPVTILNSYKEYKKFVDNNRIDYLMITNVDTVNVFYYKNGELNVLKPATTDVLLSVRDSKNNVVDYPYLFFDKSSVDKRVNFRVGICKNCKNSSLGASYGALHK